MMHVVYIVTIWIRRTVSMLLDYAFIFFPHACMCIGEEARIQVPQSVRQHLVRQASVIAPQGKAAYCVHKP